MSKDVFDDDLHNYLKEEPFECNMCGKPIEHEGYCSQRCSKADER